MLAPVLAQVLTQVSEDFRVSVETQPLRLRRPPYDDHLHRERKCHESSDRTRSGHDEHWKRTKEPRLLDAATAAA